MPSLPRGYRPGPILTPIQHGALQEQGASKQLLGAMGSQTGARHQPLGALTSQVPLEVLCLFILFPVQRAWGSPAQGPSHLGLTEGCDSTLQHCHQCGEGALGLTARGLPGTSLGGTCCPHREELHIFLLRV